MASDEGWSTVPPTPEPRPSPPRRAIRAVLAAVGLRIPDGVVVWAPVRFRDRPYESKDRPVLVVGRERGFLLVLTLSSQAAHAAHRDWYAVGTGPWDPQRRPGWARLHPYYRLPTNAVRRRGGSVDRRLFNGVRGALVRGYGWNFPNG